jgi:hypothetical protein
MRNELGDSRHPPSVKTRFPSNYVTVFILFD